MRQAKSFKRLSVPPRLNDRLLDPLSLADHVKYLYFHNRLRTVLDTIQKKGAAEKEIERFGDSADWLRAVDHLFRHWSPPWAFAYIHHTYPAHHWPDRQAGTVSPATFAFLWYHGFVDPNTLISYKFHVPEFHCLLCGRATPRTGLVLRYGVPGCGCEKRMLRPTPAYVTVSDDWSRPDIVDAFLWRAGEQRSLDVQKFDGLQQDGPVFGFVGDRRGPTEELLRCASEHGVPVFVLGKDHAAINRSRRSVAYGLELS